MEIKPAPLHKAEPRPILMIRARQLLLPGVLLASVLGGLGLLYLRPEMVLVLVAAALVGVILVSRPFTGLLILIGIMVVQPGELLEAAGALHVERVSAALVILAVVMELRQARRLPQVVGHPVLTAMYAFLGVMVLSLVGSVWLGATIAAVQSYLRTLAYSLLIINVVRTPRRLTVLMRFLMLLHTYLALTTLKGYYSGDIMFAQGISRAEGQTSFGGGPNELAATLVAAMPLFFMGFRVEKSWLWRLLWMGSLAACVWCVVLTGSRSGFLGMLMVAVLFWLMSPRKVLTLAAALALLVGLWVVMPQQYKTRYGTIKSAELDESSQGRIDAWKAGVRMFVDRPLLGVGAGNFGTGHARQAGEFQRGSWLEAHSLYVQIIAELGILGVLSFGWFLFRYLQAAVRLVRRFPLDRRDGDYRGVVARAALIACLALLVTGIFGHNLYRITWYLMGALLVVVEQAREG